MNRYLLHIGLHKTATKFFQHKVFPNLPKDLCIYNPPQLTQFFCDLIKADDDDVQLVIDAINEEKVRLEKVSNKTVVISREAMSGDLFSFYKDFDRTSSRLHAGFPDADIICFLRFQPDWIFSCYRETVHEHHYQTFKEFISNEPSDNNFVRNSYKDLDFNKIIYLLESKYGQAKTHFFFYENFKSNKEKVVKELSGIIGIDTIPITINRDSIPNRGYSGFSISLSIFRYKLCTYHAN